jgi:UDP-GlcNAc:undecaprenyl-phosphate GlcNAc-1-phosphate transferase
MYSLLLLAFASFALSLFLTPLVRDLALRFGVVDRPDHQRKIHKVPIPRVGGVAILAATIGAYALLLLFRLTAGAIVWSGVPFAFRLLPAVAVIFGVGLVDDIFEVRPRYKLAAEIVAAILAWSSGIRLIGIGHYFFSAPLSFAVTLLWIVACSNAVNLIDGVDGLAAGVGLFATITTLIAALLHQRIDLAFAIVPLAGALLAFLRFNFSPASIFLGDCGSLTIGFLLGCYGIMWSEKSTTLLSMTAPLLVLSVPLVDTGLAIARRFLRQQPLFRADRAHIHHKLLSQGMTPRRVALVLYGFCGLAGAAGLIVTATREQYHVFVLIIVCLAAWLGIQNLGYSEFGVAGRLAFGGSFQRLLNAQLALIRFEQELSAGTTLEQCWELICRECPQFGFSGIELHLDGVGWHGKIATGWHVRIEFPGYGHMILVREPGATPPGSSAVLFVLFVDCISRVFLHKLNEFKSTQSELPVYAQAD